MHKLALIVVGLLLCGISSSLSAQRRFEAGAFLDYLNVSQTSTNNFGVGGRLGYRIQPRINLEAELAYDYGVNTQQVYNNITNGNLNAIEKTSVGVTQGLIGPTLESSTGRFRPFATLKGGFMDFRLSPSLVPFSTIASTVTGIHSSSLNAALYPAAGVEASLGPVGLRLEAGDAIDFDNGAHNNLRITFGPILRF